MDWSISDISWLQQPNPGDYALRAQSSAQALGHNFLQGMQMAQENSRANALMPLRQQEMEMRLKDAALDIDVKQNMMADHLANKSGFAELSRAAATISEQGSWANPQSEKAVWDIASKFPSVMETPQFKNLLGQFDSAGLAATRAKNAEIRAQQIQNQYEISQQTLGLKEQQIKSMEAMRGESIDARERIAESNNATKIQIAEMQHERDAMEKAFDIENRAAQAGYREEVKGIFADKELALPAKQRKAKESYDRWIGNAREAKSTRPDAKNQDAKPATPSAKQDDSVTLPLDTSTMKDGTILRDKKSNRTYVIRAGKPYLQ